MSEQQASVAPITRRHREFALRAHGIPTSPPIDDPEVARTGNHWLDTGEHPTDLNQGDLALMAEVTATAQVFADFEASIRAESTDNVQFLR